VLASYVNSAQTEVRGIDVDARHTVRLPAAGVSVLLDGKWTFIDKWERTERDGSSRDFAGTHGNCDVSNCVGTPDHRVNLRAAWDRGDWRVSLNANYRGAIDNVLFKDDPEGCASHYRRRPRCAARLRTGLVHDLRPGGALEAAPGLGSVRLDREPVRQGRAARPADLWRAVV
jgi:hypothetical protein